MFSRRAFNQTLSLLLLVTLILATMPVSAADLTASKPLGSVSGAGPVQLRGIPITHEGTIFTGDQLSVGSKGYAKVILVQGQKLEMDQMTGVTITQTGTAVQLRLTSGNVGFTTSSSGSLEIIAGNYQIAGDKPNQPMSGNIARIGNDFIGIRMNSGAATLHNLFTKQAIRIPSGEERMLTVQNDPSKAPVAQVASLLPPPLPTVPPVPMPPQAGAGGGGMAGWSTLAWVSLVAAIGGGAVIVYLAHRAEVNSNEQDAALQQTTLNADYALLGANTAVSAATATATAATAASTAINNSTAVSASNKTTLTASAQSIVSQANATSAQIATLQQQLNTLASQLTGSTDTSTINSIESQINTIVAAENQDITTLNSLIAQLNSTISTASSDGATGLPSTTTITTISTVTLASSSIPKTAA